MRRAFAVEFFICFPPLSLSRIRPAVGQFKDSRHSRLVRQEESERTWLAPTTSPQCDNEGQMAREKITKGRIESTTKIIAGRELIGYTPNGSLFASSSHSLAETGQKTKGELSPHQNQRGLPRHSASCTSDWDDGRTYSASLGGGGVLKD